MGAPACSAWCLPTRPYPFPTGVSPVLGEPQLPQDFPILEKRLGSADQAGASRGAQALGWGRGEL